MKRYILNIFIFFGIIVAVDIAVGFVGVYLRDNARGGDTRQFNDLAMRAEHEILILGSSRAHHHYDSPFLSDTLGIDVYNGGIDGNGVVLAYGILEMVLNRYKPKLVVFDVEPAFDINIYKADNNHTRYISRLKPYYKEQGVDQVIKDVSIDEWRKVQSGLIRYNTGIITILMDNIIGKVDRNKGYEPMYGAMQRNLTKKDNTPGVRDNFKIGYIEKLMLLCKGREVPIILVASPKYGATNSTVFEPIVSLCLKYEVPFLNYYTMSEFMNHKEWFKEPMHFNSDGARQFSRLLVQDLERELRGGMK